MAPLSRSLTHPLRPTPHPQARTTVALPTAHMQCCEFPSSRQQEVVVPSPTPPPPFEDDEYPTGCESEYSESEDNSDGCSTRPIRASFRASFLGVRTSTIRPPRDEEEAGASANSSSETLAVDETEVPKDIKPRILLPEADPFESHGLDSSPLPPKKGSRLYRYLRWNFGSVYRRIFCLAFLGNIAALAYLVARHATSGERFTYQQASIAVTANILASLLVRNEHVVNALFWVFGTWTKSLPLGIRTLVAKVYSYGGIHSGGAVAATFWYIAYLILLTLEFQSSGDLTVIRSYIYFCSYFILFLLVSMLISAHPHLRRVMHNWFEGIHRAMGWLAVLLFWAQVMLLTAEATQATGSNTPFGKALLVSPNFWMLVVITLLVVYPWTRLRLRNVYAEVLSEHCVKLNFDFRNVHYGQAIRLTDAPLKETHAFGVIPFPAAPATPPAPPPMTHCPGCVCTANPEKTNVTADGNDDSVSLSDLKAHARASSPTAGTTTTAAGALSHAGERGFSVIVSNAGDWTRKIIQQPPKQIYTRGIPQFGVFRVAGMFTPCVVVATGSGIAPCLSLFVQRPDHPVRIVWSAKEPLKTYGRAVVELVYRTDPDAVVIDTSKGGPRTRRPDLVGIAYRVREQGRVVVPGGAPKKAEAVVIISNQKVTKKVVYGLESRGVPAYGAIFDS
ncbi:hypothetical protein MFIFM68171_05461 [Madurella fahalii]|uniref:Uncharacterized protein n=1 Tax=Madurella fahalii TaxID=1157608 RepID=A0ABQ0GBY6_9PEZI